MSAASIYRDEPVGNPVTVISHPNYKFYLLTQGHVSRYYMNKEKMTFMNITADYAKGSSGGPLFNNRGDLIGLVSSTTSLSANFKTLPQSEEQRKTNTKKNKKSTMIKQDHQMTLKNCVPSRAILKLIE
jgi:V8-like Glu-specific endopeptidase